MKTASSLAHSTAVWSYWRSALFGFCPVAKLAFTTHHGGCDDGTATILGMSPGVSLYEIWVSAAYYRLTTHAGYTVMCFSAGTQYLTKQNVSCSVRIRWLSSKYLQSLVWLRVFVYIPNAGRTSQLLL